MSILVGSRVSRMSLVYFFDFSTVTASTVTGWCVIASFMLSSFAGGLPKIIKWEAPPMFDDFPKRVGSRIIDFSTTYYEYLDNIDIHLVDIGRAGEVTFDPIWKDFMECDII
ncbi:hypothetical protein L1049_004008 [Liquidambar formosana]|uniref:Uncharacterized protein n=1 Tax=Liquidambar formosana TaxID=63359 RepID=A0AAP0RNM1_LIQFO